MRGRPPIGVRATFALIGVIAVLVVVTLMLSDRAPGILQSVGGPFVDRVSERLDADGSAAAALGARDVGSDSIVHVALWGVTMSVVGLAVWSWILILPTAGLLFVGSVAVELAQGRYSDRNVELRDVVFNGLGIASGTVVAVVCFVVAASISSLGRRRDVRG